MRGKLKVEGEEKGKRETEREGINNENIVYK